MPMTSGRSPKPNTMRLRTVCRARRCGSMKLALCPTPSTAASRTFGDGVFYTDDELI